MNVLHQIVDELLQVHDAHARHEHHHAPIELGRCVALLGRDACTGCHQLHVLLLALLLNRIGQATESLVDRDHHLSSAADRQDVRMEIARWLGQVVERHAADLERHLELANVRFPSDRKSTRLNSSH